MTDMTKPVIAPPRSLFSGELMQLLYRLSAALLICIFLALLNDSFLSLGNNTLQANTTNGAFSNTVPAQ